MGLFFRKGLSRVSSKIVQKVAPAGSDPRRALMLHDAIRLGELAMLTGALLGLTLICFHSFEEYQSRLAADWSRKGVAAMNEHPAVAVQALRTSLSYEHDEGRIHDDQVLLAEALASDGRLEEAKDYFLALWESTPGDGLINLELARIAHRLGEENAAANYYRASIVGVWQGDAIRRRDQVRVEFADLLIAENRGAEARNVLLAAAANAPDDAGLNGVVGQKLSAAGFASDALSLYERAVTASPKDRVLLALAGKTALDLNRYAEAEAYLTRAMDAETEGDVDRLELTPLADEARRLQQLNLGNNQPATERAAHLLEAAAIAQSRLQSCMASAPAGSDAQLQALGAEWTSAQPKSSAQRKTLSENAVIQDFWADLVYSTEIQTAMVCGAPTGDDAVLLRLAKAAKGPVPTAAAPGTLPTPSATSHPGHPSFFNRFFSSSSSSSSSEARPNGK